MFWVSFINYKMFSLLGQEVLDPSEFMS